MKISLLSGPTQETLAAALACYRKVASLAGHDDTVAQIAVAEAELEAPVNGAALAIASKAAGVVYTDFANHGYGLAEENPFVKAARANPTDGIDFDDKTVVAQGGRGAYVSCWYWVPNEAAGIPEISDLLEELLGYLGTVERDNPTALAAVSDLLVLRHQRDVVDDLVVHLCEELDDLCDSEISLPESIVHKVYNLGSGAVETFPSCILKELSAVAEKTGFDAVKVGHLNNWIEMNGRKLDHLVTTL
ncbi:TPA: hypothetical protein ACKP9S_002730 [Pseudomonas aeruginosa]